MRMFHSDVRADLCINNDSLQYCERVDHVDAPQQFYMDYSVS